MAFIGRISNLQSLNKVVPRIPFALEVEGIFICDF
jgi:hypothetical protein